MECQRVPIREAAALLGVGVSTVRDNMRIGEWDLGSYISKKKTKKKKDAFYVYREKLNRHMAISTQNNGS